jgi:hypothetical protein
MTGQSGSYDVTSSIELCAQIYSERIAVTLW